MLSYLLFGAGFYLGVCISRIETFKGEGLIPVLKGALLGFLLWPLAIGILAYVKRQELRKQKEKDAKSS